MNGPPLLCVSLAETTWLGTGKSIEVNLVTWLEIRVSAESELNPSVLTFRIVQLLGFEHDTERNWKKMSLLQLTLETHVASVCTLLIRAVNEKLTRDQEEETRIQYFLRECESRRPCRLRDTVEAMSHE